MGAKALVIGVDEVGRGPFAGPVMAAAGWLSRQAADRLAAAGLNDSKKLTAKKREKLAALIKAEIEAGAAAVTLGAASVREIETLNILGATGLAMQRAVARFSARIGPPSFALVDGNRAPRLPCPVETIIGGDGASLSIAAAAVIAKVSRDRLMRRLALRYPAYAWERNAGYGSSPPHRAAILAHGLTPHHRRGFCRRLLEEAGAAAHRLDAEEKTDKPGRDERKRNETGRQDGSAA